MDNSAEVKNQDMLREASAKAYDKAIADCCQYLETIKNYNPARCREMVRRFLHTHSGN